MNNTFLKKTSLIKTALIKTSIFGALVFSAQLAFAVPAGSVTFKSGDATITHADNTVVPAEKSASLNEGDTIETKNGRVQLAFINGGKVSLQPNTIYKINKFTFSGKEDGTEYNFTELVKGGLRTISGLIGHKNRSHYQVKTVVATIGIRGTEYTAFFDSTLTMTTNHGSVDVCSLTGGCLIALTGQTIMVAPNKAPAYSDKQASISAAKPVPTVNKVVFTKGEQADVAEIIAVATNVTGTGTGSDTIVSLATMPVGVVDNNGVYKGTTTFSSNDLISYVDNSGTPIILTGRIEEVNSDTFVKWGRASGGTYNGQPMLMTNWITGIATPSAAISALNGAGIIGTYAVTSSTAPYIVSGGVVTTGLTNSVTGGLILDFSRYKFSYTLNIPIAGNNISIAGLNVPITAVSAKFSDNNAIITGAAVCGCPITGSGILFNNASVEGSLFGPNAERAGLQYGVQVSGSGLPGGGGNLFGGVVLNK